MTRERIIEMARQFPENGMKLLLQQPDNTRELLALAQAPLLDRIDFDHMVVDPTTYVSADFRHVSSDLVLRVPLRPERGHRRRRFLSLTILIEHQSVPDRLMILRVLDYLVQIWKAQVRAWGVEHGSLANVHLQPILPVVFYTGLHRWEQLGGLLDLMVEASAFRSLTPEFQPLFVNLPQTPAAELAAVGSFGQVLQLVQARKTAARRFSQQLQQVVGSLETMQTNDRLRWQDLLSYLQALVYHDRAASEHEGLTQCIVASARTDEDREELNMARRSMADVVRAEGEQRGEQRGELRARQQMLLVQLRERYKRLPAAVEQTVETTSDPARLDEWIKKFATAESLDAIGILPGD